MWEGACLLCVAQGIAKCVGACTVVAEGNTSHYCNQNGSCRESMGHDALGNLQEISVTSGMSQYLPERTSQVQWGVFGSILPPRISQQLWLPRLPSFLHIRVAGPPLRGLFTQQTLRIVT